MDDFVNIGVPLIAAVVGPVVSVFLTVAVGDWRRRKQPVKPSSWPVQIGKRYLLLVTVVVGLLSAGAAIGLVKLGEEAAAQPANRPPEVERISMSPEVVHVCQRIQLLVIVSDSDGDPLTVRWTAYYGNIEPLGPTARSDATYTAPDFPPAGSERVTVEVDDGRGGRDTRDRSIPILPSSGRSASACP